ncbi:MAG: flagellar filament capping protein FliD [Proteobacteria bacterium]|nr:flagellar filament capping protein FliD [Pseudomonadota bacterium]
MTDLNVSNTSFSSSGTLQFSGLSSGIDIQAAVNSIMAAKRQPAVNYENKIAANNDKISAFGQLKTITSAFSDILNKLRGQVGFFKDSVFDSKVSFTSSRATAAAPVGHSASSADSILGVSVSKKAQVGRHTVEVVQLAQQHQIRSDAFTSKTTDLQTLGFTTGNISINGKNIVVDPSDTLTDLKDKINTSNAGVTASIVSVSGTEHYLVFTAKNSGSAAAIDFAGGNAVTDSLGLTNAGAVKNELAAAQDAIIHVDNLGVDVIRSSNTISDVLDGVTLDLFSAEPDTEVVIDIENNLQDVKQSVQDFVDAYNLLKDFIDDQRSKQVRTDGGDEEFGPLAFDQTLRSINQRLAQIIGASVAGQPDGFSSLGQIGVTMNSDFRLEIDSGELDSKLLSNLEDVQRLFEFQATTSDSRVTVTGFNANVQAGTYYMSVGGTDVNGDVTSANIGTVAGAGIGGADDGSLSVNGIFATGTAVTGANGLNLAFNGGPNAAGVDDIEITVSRGLADQLFSLIDEFGKGVTGTIDKNIAALTDQNDQLNDRVVAIDTRLEITRASLTARFIAMEQAIAQANSLKDSLNAITQSQNNSNN